MNHYDYLEAGFRVFGINGVDKNGCCECGNPDCKAILKHPRISNWQHTPDWSDEQLDAMEQSGQFSVGFGVLVSGYLVVDVDARNGGVASYEKLRPLLGDPAFVVNTGSGNGSQHIYYRAPAGVAMVQHHNDYPGIDFKTTGFVIGAGSLHASGASYEADRGHPCDITDAPQELIDLLRKPDQHRATVRGKAMDVSDQEIIQLLSHVSADCDYDTWYKCGMAIHEATAGTGFDIWDEWSNSGSKYPGRAELEKKWHSFGKTTRPVTLGTLIYYAEQSGYVAPVTFDSEQEETHGHPFPIGSVDLLRPPGFVGDVTQWINAQCRYPREHLAVAAALTAVGNVSGLRYTDDQDGVTSNLFAFCVSASATGKEAVQQAMHQIHRAAGVQGATHGSIKSEQEIVRNLIRHQGAFYVIDEIGILLAKIVNAQKRGGAVYLDGVIGMLMAAYSKADGFMLLTGDTKEEVRRALAAELAQCRKAVSENEDKDGHNQRRIPQLQKALSELDNGLDRPFLSMIGFTTPVTFDDLVTYEQATNGFVGRSLLIREMETNPRAKRGFRKQAMPESMRASLQNLYSPGEFNHMAGRVEYYGERVPIPTDREAADMLCAVLDWLEDYAEQHKGKTGLEAIVRRGYELMAKVSLILAAPEGLRTSEHVRWAYAIMRRDIDEKIRLAYGNMNEGVDGLAASILGMVSHDHGETLAVMANRTRKYTKAQIEKALAAMEKEGMVKRVETMHPKSGKEIVKWYSI